MPFFDAGAGVRGYLPMKNHLGLPCHVKTWDWKIIIISKVRIQLWMLCHWKTIGLAEEVVGSVASRAFSKSKYLQGCFLCGMLWGICMV